jgi:hypothetical protein
MDDCFTQPLVLAKNENTPISDLQNLLHLYVGNLIDRMNHRTS